MFIFDYLMMLIGVLLSVAFFTLVERKLLGYIHFRKGPTKLFYFGLLQPISDALKLFSKETMKGYKFSFYLYVFGPFLGLSIMLILWSIYGCFFGNYGSSFSLLYMLCFMSLSVYFLLFSGWGSNSKYSLLGAYRSVSQTVSYEVSMIFFIFFTVYLVSSYDYSLFAFFQNNYWFSMILMLYFFSWLYIILAESNRTPFDFSEGESELVSGFNVEYGSGIFSLIFICEYGMIIFLSFLTVTLFLGGSSFFIKIILICLGFVWVRCCFPRYRYDFLMNSAWKILLPFSLFFLILSVSLFFSFLEKILI